MHSIRSSSTIEKIAQQISTTLLAFTDSKLAKKT